MPQPICIFLPNSEELDPTPELKKLFADEIGDLKLALISVCGSLRGGKSFLLDFFISYLRAGGEPNWMNRGIPNGQEDGFPYKRTQEAVTKGILIWPEYFKITAASGEEIVILLMDTQGLYDANTTMEESTSLFALSTLLSSVQIFNVEGNIKADHLNNLELFAQFSRRISEGSKQDHETCGKPFQKLIFLVRDWLDPRENAYGWGGGEEKLRKLFEDASVAEELASMRNHIKDCFESIKCFLMPHPGSVVAQSTEFRGELSDIADDFKTQVRIFIEEILQPKNLRPKKFNGEELKVRQFADFVNSHVQELRSGKYPTIERIFSVTVEAQNSAIVENCFSLYLARVSEDLDNNPLEPLKYDIQHSDLVNEIFARFWNSNTMGDKSAVDKAFGILKLRIASVADRNKEFNRSNYEKKQQARYRMWGKAAGVIAGFVTGAAVPLISAKIVGVIALCVGGVGGVLAATPIYFYAEIAAGGKWLYKRWRAATCADDVCGIPVRKICARLRLTLKRTNDRNVLHGR